MLLVPLDQLKRIASLLLVEEYEDKFVPKENKRGSEEKKETDKVLRLKHVTQAHFKLFIQSYLLLSQRNIDSNLSFYSDSLDDPTFLIVVEGQIKGSTSTSLSSVKGTEGEVDNKNNNKNNKILEVPAISFTFLQSELSESLQFKKEKIAQLLKFLFPSPIDIKNPPLIVFGTIDSGLNNTLNEVYENHFPNITDKSSLQLAEAPCFQRYLSNPPPAKFNEFIQQNKVVLTCPDYPNINTEPLIIPPDPSIGRMKSYKVYFGRLRSQDSENVWKFWPYRHQKPPKAITKIIQNFNTVAAFITKDQLDDQDKEVNDNNKDSGNHDDDNMIPISWCLSQAYCGLGMLHTKDLFRRSGIAAHVIVKLSHLILNDKNDHNTGIRNNIPFCYVVKSNKASNSLFDKLGFDYAQDLSWLYSKQLAW